MRKVILGLLILLLSCSVCYAAEEFNFRGVTWGMTPEEVKAVETALGQLPEEAEERIDSLNNLNLLYRPQELLHNIRRGLV